MTAPIPPRVVVAVSPQARPRIRAILPAVEPRFVETGAELLRALDEQHCDLLIVDPHFEASSAAAAQERARHCIDLSRYPADALGNARLQATLERLIERARR